MENFLGKDGFVWFYGVVEDNNDPAKLGRAKVRIFGWHTDNLKELPTTDLPWAQPLNPPNSSKTFSAPRLGDYVMGFFSDGMSAQAPVLLGVFPGLEVAANLSKGFSPQSTLPQATPPEGQVQYEPGKPTIAPLAREVVANTAISQSNKNLAHVCDISLEVKYDIAKLTLSVNSTISTIRTELQALWASSSSSPFVDEIRNEVTTVKNQIKDIKKEIKNQTEPLQEIQKIVQSLQDLIVYIGTLPARIATQLKGCLDAAASGINEAVSLANQIQPLIDNKSLTQIEAKNLLLEELTLTGDAELKMTAKEKP